MAQMYIYKDAEQIKQLSIFGQLDYPVALTAPLIAEDRALIGLYCYSTGAACIDIDVHEFVRY